MMIKREARRIPLEKESTGILHMELEMVKGKKAGWKETHHLNGGS